MCVWGGLPVLVCSRLTVDNWDAHTRLRQLSGSGKIPGICETRGTNLTLLQVNPVSLGESPRFHGAPECDIPKMDSLKVSYIDSPVRKELMKPFMYLGLSGLRSCFLLVFILLIVLLKTCVFLLQRIAKERQKQYNCLMQRIEREKKLFVIAQKIQTRKDLLVSRESLRPSFYFIFPL